MAIKGSRRAAVSGLPLPTLLSQMLVAYTIEFDNEFERQMPHRTTDAGGPAHAPWLVSLVMYANFMRFIPDEGITVRELYMRSGLEKKALQTWLKRMAGWWGYLTLHPPADGKPAPPADWIVRPSPGGLRALQVWRPLFATIEERWRQRFGEKVIDGLRSSFGAVGDQLQTGLPEYLSILGVVWAGWFAEAPKPGRGIYAAEKQSAVVPVSALLSWTLMAFTLDFERESDLSLAIGSNLVRVLDDTGIPVRDLPRLSGVSKEAIKMMLGFLTKHRFVAIEADLVAGRIKVVRLTAKGIEAQQAFGLRLALTEKDWRKRFGDEAIGRLRTALEAVVIDAGGGPSPLMERLMLHPEGWRASRSVPETLPHYPLVLHRGGFPDGS
jgi:DNA-binding MarR family transcriptional regulator